MVDRIEMSVDCGIAQQRTLAGISRIQREHWAEITDYDFYARLRSTLIHGQVWQDNGIV